MFTAACWQYLNYGISRGAQQKMNKENIIHTYMEYYSAIKKEIMSFAGK
jgi:hypothetical protein